MSPAELVRLINALLAAIALLAFLVRINDEWVFMGRGRRVQRCAFAFGLLVLALGSVEGALTQPPVPLGIRSFLSTVFVTTLLFGMWLARRDQSPVEGGWVRASEMADLLHQVDAESDLAGCQRPECIRARLRMWAMIEDAGVSRYDQST